MLTPKKSGLIYFSCLIFLLGFFSDSYATVGSAHLTSPDKLTYPSLSFKPPQAERLVLDNGLIVYVLEDHELPLVDIHAVFRTGSYFDPEGKEGLAEMTGTVMRTGGTINMTGDAVDEALASLAVDIGIGVKTDSCTIGFSSLKDTLEPGLDILSQIIRAPLFDNKKFGLARNLKEESLRRIADDPQQLAFREFKKVFYHGDPRGRLPSLSSINTITIADLREWYGKYFHPDNMMLAITGDITKEEALLLLEKYFGNWPKGEKSITIPPPAHTPANSIYYLPKDVPQSIIITGESAPAQTDAAFYPFTVLDFILGSGGFRSRIFQEIRTNEGLAYSAGSFYQARTDFGVFGTYAFTKSSSTAKVLSLLHSLTIGTDQAPITPEELAWAINSINNSFIFSFSSAEQIASQQMMLEFERLPRDYLLNYRDRISAVKLEDLKKAAQRYLISGQVLTLVLGKAKDFDKPLSSFGSVTTLQAPND